MKPKKKKTSADYPQIQFKVTTEVRTEIMGRIKVLTDYYNENLEDGECRFRGNDIAIEALRKGLTLIEKKIK